jgi:uncharacterized protein YcfJ
LSVGFGGAGDTLWLHDFREISSRGGFVRPMKHMHSIIVLAALACLSFPASAQNPIAYPAQGQSAEQQSRDGSECYAWAQQSTGINPATAAAQPVQGYAPTGQRLAGAARGALGGAAIGAIADGEAGKGAAIGAVVGTMAGGRQARRQQAVNQTMAQTQQSQVASTYYRAYAACMQGRGYAIQ